MAAEDNGRTAKGTRWESHSLADVRRVWQRHNRQTRPADVQWRSVHRVPPPLANRSTKSGNFETGIKVIDVLVPLERGGKADSSAGQAWARRCCSLKGSTNMIRHHDGISIFCGIGERCREGEELYRRHEGSQCVAEYVIIFGQTERAAWQPLPRGPRRADHGRVFPGRRAP